MSRPLGVLEREHGGVRFLHMATPIDPTAPDAGTSPSSRMEELREKLRPRDIAGPGEPRIPAGERFALERVQALELQLTRAHERERELTELAVRDGNQIASLEVRVTELADRAERAEVAERSLFEAENRAETAIRRAELMETELASTRSEVDRLRTRVVELEASLRRALAEVGAATAQRARDDRDVAIEDASRLEESAERSLELADRLRLKVVDLESNLRAVMQEANEATAAKLRAEYAESELEARDAEDAPAGTAEAESRLADLERRLASLDERIASLSTSVVVEDAPETVVDLREAEEAAQEPTQPAPSRWSEWRAT
jgi:DNA repair exonuclease SbcCD ATPase subunit